MSTTSVLGNPLRRVVTVIPEKAFYDYAVRHGTTRAYWSRGTGDPQTPMELPLILSLFGAVALTLVVPAIRGIYRR